MVYLCYISCLRYTILVGNPRYTAHWKSNWMVICELVFIHVMISVVSGTLRSYVEKNMCSSILWADVHTNPVNYGEEGRSSELWNKHRGTGRQVHPSVNTFSCLTESLKVPHRLSTAGIHAQGLHLREKTTFFTPKKSRLRKSENAVRLLYAKNSDLTHQKVFSLFVFCTQQRRFVEHLPWV